MNKPYVQFLRMPPVAALALVSNIVLTTALLIASGQSGAQQAPLVLGDRPALLASLMNESPLQHKLVHCDLNGINRSDLSFGHRGAPLQFAEHTREGYITAANQGATVLECDVTFTKDKELVCRHSQCDLHTTTNILATGLAQKCSIPPDTSNGTPYVNAKCCTSDITLAEFRTLKGKRDGGNKLAANPDDFFAGTPGWIGDADKDYGELLSHKDSIALFDSLGVAMAPELKAAQTAMPFGGVYSQQQYATQMLNDYIEAGIKPSQVYAQSFNLDDLRFWQKNFPAFAKQAVFLDGRYRNPSFDIDDSKSWNPSMDALVAEGIHYLAPPIWMLLTLDAQGEIVPSQYAIDAKEAGLNLIAWTVERGGSITSGKNWYYQSIQSAINGEGDVFQVIDVLAKQVNVTGIFSDWPATTTYYDHCTQ